MYAEIHFLRITITRFKRKQPSY